MNTGKGDAISERYDVAVVGGGVTGLSTLMHLQKSGISNCVLVEKAKCGWGGTYKSGTLVRTHYVEDLSTLIAVRSLKYFQQNDNETGFRKSGFVIGVGDRDVGTLAQVIEMNKRCGANTKLLGSTSELDEIDPLMNHENFAAVAYEPESGFADAIKTVMHFKAKAIEFGGVIKENTPVKEIKKDGNEVSAIKTDKDEIKADSVVIAAGPWSIKFAEDLGDMLPIRYRRSPILITQGPKGFGDNHPAFYDMVSGIYGKPNGGDTLLTGPGLLSGAASASGAAKSFIANLMRPSGGYKLLPDSFNGALFDSETTFLYERAKKTYPLLEHGHPKMGWAGMIDDCSDGFELIGKSPSISNVYYATGFSGHGFKEAPAIGEIIAQLLQNGRSEIDIGRYSVDRFVKGRPVTPPFSYVGE